MLTLLLGLALGGDPPGRWYPDAYRSRADDPALTPDERARAAQLEALGYATAGEGPPGEGVVRRTADAGEGFVLLTEGHAAAATLIDLDGRVVHRWAAPLERAWPDHPELLRHASAHHWRRVALLPDGGLLAIHEGIGLVRLDAASRVLWATRNQAHHDLLVEGDTAWVLTRRTHPRGGSLPVLEDFVAEVDLASGRERRRTSVLAALARSPWGELALPPEGSGDVLHTNSLHRLPDGRFLVGSRVHGFFATLDPASGALTGLTRGPWRRQHDVEQGPSGRIWLFDNQGAGEGRSRVLALAGDGVPAWSWGAEQGLWSEVLGTVQELPDGSVLITESTRGRAVQVAPDGRILWDYRSPHTHGDRVAALFEAVRVVPPDTLSVQALP